MGACSSSSSGQQEPLEPELQAFHDGAVLSVCHTGTHLLATAGEDAKIALYDLNSSKVQQEWQGHKRAVNRCIYGPM
jgi:WD40 repeat protein